MTSQNQALNLIEQYKQAGGDSAALMSAINTVYSADKTSLGLNQWQLTDKPRMEDFNQDNRIIDERLVELQKKTDGKTGTWTPRIYGETKAGNPVYTQRTGSFYTIGSLTICSGTIALSSKGGMEGIVTIDGLSARNRFVIASPSCNSGGLTLSSGQIFTGFCIYSNSARLRYQTNTTSGWITADMIKDNFSLSCFNFIYASV